MKNTFSGPAPNELPDFVLRSYSKSQLAHLYLPHLSARSALRTWSNWVQIHPTLLLDLFSTGYRKRNKVLNPVQVKIVVEALGYP